jgi:NAD(P)H-flavin reductase
MTAPMPTIDPAGVMVPLPYRITRRRVELPDTVTLELAPVGRAIEPYAPGQFTMVYSFGVGEVPISISGEYRGETLVHTLRAVGAVTRALHAAGEGTVLGIRGPFGAPWGVPAPAGADVLVAAGGIGLAPLRPVIRTLLAQRGRYRRVTVLVGARTPADLLYPDEYDQWRQAGADVLVTVDRAGASWHGAVGVVTTLLDRIELDPPTLAGYLCGPEPMMRFTAQALLRKGVPAQAVQVSLERNMRCGVAWCGHCQLGPTLLCRDGPVLGYDVAEPLLAIKEL